MAPTSAEIAAPYQEAFRRLTRGWEQGQRLLAFLEDAADVAPDYKPGAANEDRAPPEGRFRLAGVPSGVDLPGKLGAQALAGFDLATRTVLLRDEQVTDEFRALVLAHNLLHALDAVTDVWAALTSAAGDYEGSLRGEVRAYELEMDFADQITEGEFFRTLDDLMMELGQREDQHFLEEEGPPQLNRLFPPPRSQREGASRLLFFTVAAAYWYTDTVAVRNKLKFMDEWWQPRATRY